MSKATTYSQIDFSNINPEQVRRLVTDLYESYRDEKRDFQFGLTAERRQLDRRQLNKAILLDTRTHRSRRQSSGRRQREDNSGNKHKVGIDYYV